MMLKQALANGDKDGVAAQLTPGAMTLFEDCRTLALNTDTTNLNARSQIGVLIGFQAYWLIDQKKLRSMSTADFLAWVLHNDVVQIGNLATLDLRDIQVLGSRATAYMKRNNNVITNTVVPFEFIDGKWKLDFKEMLLASEKQLARSRTGRHINKADAAVMIIEGMYKQAVPVLRELLLPPRVCYKIKQLKDADSAHAYDNVISELSAGRQDDAEMMLEVLVAIHTNDQRLAFAQAVCNRSRFDKNEADWQFRQVLDMSPHTVEGKFSRYMLDLDDRNAVENGFKGLHLLSEENPKNPLLLWMIGVQCRDNYRHESTTNRSVEGIIAYERVLKIFDVGPVLVHQTYANILSEELGRHEEALPHRRIAVQLKPAAWTYEGLAHTLSKMRKYEEANKAFAKIIEFDSSDAQYWYDWARSLQDQKKWDECIEKCQKALAIDEDYHYARSAWANALEKQGKFKEAFEQYEETIRIDPVDFYACNGAARMLRKLGDFPEAARRYRKTADQGDAYAQSNLGACYEKGDGVPKDYTEAVKWYRKAADQGDAYSQCCLALFYVHRHEAAKALEWYGKAAAQGDATAMYNSALIYHHGRGVPTDHEKSFQLFQQAAEHGEDSPTLCAYLGWCYQDGLGVVKDDARAFEWYRKGAEGGDRVCMDNLGRYYYNGIGVSQDIGQAVKWAKKSADTVPGMLAWIYATSPDPAYRNAKEAVVCALKNTSKKPRNWGALATLAAAYACDEQFDKAIEIQLQAIELLAKNPAKTSKLTSKYENRLELYRNHQPYIEPMQPSQVKQPQS